MLGSLVVALMLQSSVTECRPFLNSVRCETTGGSTGPTDYGRLQARPDYSGFAALGASIRAKKARARTRKVGKLLAEGRCDDAVAAALDDGNIDLAREARSFCAEKP